MDGPAQPGPMAPLCDDGLTYMAGGDHSPRKPKNRDQAQVPGRNVISRGHGQAVLANQIQRREICVSSLSGMNKCRAQCASCLCVSAGGGRLVM